MRARMVSLLAFTSLLATTPVFADTAAPAPAKQHRTKGQGTPQTHHCFKDGQLLADLTHKKCTAQGGTWQKDAAREQAPGDAAPSPK